MDDLLLQWIQVGIKAVVGAIFIQVLVRHHFFNWTIGLVLYITGILLALMTSFADLSLSQTVFVLAIVGVSTVVGINCAAAYYERRLRAIRPTIKRIVNHEYEAVIRELLAKHAGGAEWRAEDTLMLAAAYLHAGDADSAEPYLLEAKRMLEEDGTSQLKNKLALRVYHYALVSLAEVQVLHGRFHEAARMMTPLPQSLFPNADQAIAAFYLYLDRQYDEAGALLNQLKPIRNGRPENLVYPRFHLMVAFMQYQLLGHDTLRTMHRLAKEYAKWEDEYQRNAHNPYGRRLRRVLDELQPLLPDRYL
ncbi:MAG: hypothetical protein GYB65_17745 [Chloroflexi bacterium]|nr:hypothetical protein [Chloroflexota bacterium]